MIEELSENLKNRILRHFEICNKCKKVKIIDNLKEYLTAKQPEEYTPLDNVFFNKYSSKEVFVYKYTNCPCDDDWFILEDNNYPIDVNCFIDLEKE